MPWLQLKIEVAATAAEQLSDCLTDLGANAVTFEDAADQPVFEPPPGEAPLWQATRVIGLFAAETDMAGIIAALRATLDIPPSHARVDILEDQAWSRAWLEHFKPSRFGQRLWVIPSGYAPPDPHGVNLYLDPGLAFGTGTHPTTALCLKWLDAHPPEGQTVIDYGCGSGILAVAAALLGATQVDAVDHDPQALIATRENAVKNNTGDAIWTGFPAELRPIEADLILANILANPLIELQPQLTARVRPGGHIVLSGILRSQLDNVLESYKNNFDIKDVNFEDDWCRIAGRRFG